MWHNMDFSELQIWIQLHLCSTFSKHYSCEISFCWPVPLLLTQCQSNSFPIPKSRHGPASTVITLWNERPGVKFQTGARDFSFSKLSGLAVEPTSLLFNGNRQSFPWVKKAETWSWPLTSDYYRGKKWGELYLYFPYMPCTGTIVTFLTVLTSCAFRRQWLLSCICLTVDTLTVHTKVLMWQNITQTAISIKKLHHILQPFY